MDIHYTSNSRGILLLMDFAFANFLKSIDMLTPSHAMFNGLFCGIRWDILFCIFYRLICKEKCCEEPCKKICVKGDALKKLLGIYMVTFYSVFHDILYHSLSFTCCSILSSSS